MQIKNSHYNDSQDGFPANPRSASYNTQHNIVVQNLFFYVVSLLQVAYGQNGS
jgi:hypothetical protein